MCFGKLILNVNISDYHIDCVPLKYEHVYQNLVIYVDVKLKFHRYVDNRVGRIGSMMSNLLRSTICRSIEFMVSLWVSHLRPLIEYGSCLMNEEY